MSSLMGQAPRGSRYLRRPMWYALPSMVMRAVKL